LEINSGRREKEIVMRGGRFGKYGEFKRFERLRQSKAAKRDNQKSRLVQQTKKPSLIKKENKKLEAKNNVGREITEEIKCGKCGSGMEFYGVDGTGGKKYNCPSCYDKIVTVR
jgi:hypothetical protein